MTVVVSGATLTAMPSPSTVIGGKKVVQYDPPMPGRADRTNPTAEMIGPVISGIRAP